MPASSRCRGRNRRSARRAARSARRPGSAPRRAAASREDQAEHLGGGVVAGLGRGDERPRLAPRVDAAARAVGEAAADADLLVEPRAVAAAEHRIGDERAIVTRVAPGERVARHRDRRLARAGHVDRR